MPTTEKPDKCIARLPNGERCGEPVNRERIEVEHGEKWKKKYCTQGHMNTCERLDRRNPYFPGWPIV